MQRIKITIAYNGKAYFGSQEQKHKKTVVGDFHFGLQKLNIKEKAIFSGRTDKGVHSTGQVLHIDIPTHWTIENFSYAIKRVLPKAIIVRKCEFVNSDFHSRFSAKRRIYRYIFSTSSENPFENEFVTFISGKDFDFEKMRKAIAIFQGTHNFKNFKKIGSDNHSDIRTIFKTQAYKFGRYFILKFEANSFLRSQVRLMVGALFEIAYGKLEISELKKMVDEVSQKQKKIAPPNGLYLTKVIY